MRPIFITIEQRLIDKQHFVEIQPNNQYYLLGAGVVVLSAMCLFFQTIRASSTNENIIFHQLRNKRQSKLQTNPKHYKTTNNT
jgi:hypothetical protein